jgi:hypothetical protein
MQIEVAMTIRGHEYIREDAIIVEMQRRERSLVIINTTVIQQVILLIVLGRMIRTAIFLVSIAEAHLYMYSSGTVSSGPS